jgi:electron transfer flavoprotein beta subunit
MIVIVRESWDARDLVGEILTPEGGLKESVLSARFNPEDMNALEMALQVKEKQGGTVAVLALGEPRNVDVLRECLYRETDEVIRIECSNPRALDTAAQATLFRSAIQKRGGFDVIFSGFDVAEGENSMLGIELGSRLGIETISYADRIEMLQPGKISVKREISNGYEIVESRLPAMLIVGVALLKDDPRTPRSAKATLKLKHKKTAIPVVKPSEIGLADPEALRTTELLRYEAVPERQIESREVDCASESALKSMLEEIRRGG